MKPSRPNAAVLLAAALCMLAAAPHRAFATLGETSASVAGAAARMHATMVQPAATATPTAPAPALGFTVAQFRTPAGVSVREYIAPGGTVFAVSWRGVAPPDLAALLGTYFTQYRNAAAAGSPTTFGLHNSLVVGPDVTVETGGHMGDLWGRAYVPTMLPPGVSQSEIE
jgi:Protein of unknown function (DUF2844)